MEPVLKQGKLITWKNDRGFGFIKPDDESKEVFLHINVLKKTERRPKVGDIILYERVIEPTGKVRATRASIQGITPRSLANRQTPRKRNLLKMVAGTGMMTIIALLAMEKIPSHFPSLITSILKPGCMIKGNISIDTSNKIYHLPGMEDYELTVIDPKSGEQWFCTESEAIASGWRKASR